MSDPLSRAPLGADKLAHLRQLAENEQRARRAVEAHPLDTNLVAAHVLAQNLLEVEFDDASVLLAVLDEVEALRADTAALRAKVQECEARIFVAVEMRDSERASVRAVEADEFAAGHYEVSRRLRDALASRSASSGESQP